MRTHTTSSFKITRFKRAIGTALCSSLLLASAAAGAQGLPGLGSITAPLTTMLGSSGSTGGGNNSGGNGNQGGGNSSAGGLSALGSALNSLGSSNQGSGNQGNALSHFSGGGRNTMAPLPGLENLGGNSGSNTGSNSGGFGEGGNSGSQDRANSNQGEESNTRFSRRDAFNTDQLRIGRQGNESGGESSGSGQENRVNGSGFNAVDFSRDTTSSNSSTNSGSSSGNSNSGSNGSTRQNSSNSRFNQELGGQLSRNDRQQSGNSENNGDNGGNSASDSRNDSMLGFSSSFTVEHGGNSQGSTSSQGSDSGN